MIPPDVANALRAQLPTPQNATQLAQVQPVASAQHIDDFLSNLAPGQRVFAEIQALLPNGTYRAVVAQRNITLALPFSAKPGDSLELEVIETGGKLALAFVGDRSPGAGDSPRQESVPTSLSQTGKLIGDLLGGIDNQGKRAPPVPLNGSQPLVQTMPKLAAELAPVLKQALAQSGMFYEAHQARWVAGELPTARLLQEPQGQHSQTRGLQPEPPQMERLSDLKNPTLAASDLRPLVEAQKQTAVMDAPEAPARIATAHPDNPQAKLDTSPESSPVHSNMPPSGMATELTEQAASSQASATQQSENGQEAISHSAERSEAKPQVHAENPAARQIPSAINQSDQTYGHIEQAANRGSLPNPSAGLPPELAPLVQQQLDALATQTFAWQGQIWPGQQMYWEIDEQRGNPRKGENEAGGQWETRLKLKLPLLGDIEASLHLRPGNEIGVSLSVKQDSSSARLESASQLLKQQFEAAGLNLTQFSVKNDTPIK